MYCKQCGAYMPEEAGFCPACGTRVSENAQPARRARGRNTIVIVAIVVVAAVFAAAVFGFTQYLNKYQEEQYAAALSEQQAEEAAKMADKTEEEEKEETPTTQTTVTNNYYYYGSDASDDNDYYTESISSGYLWPTDTQYISTADLRGLSQDTVAAIRNEIYARHGYAFTTERWQDYFAGKTWYYRDSTCDETTVRARLSSIERANISTIVAYEESKGWR